MMDDGGFRPNKTSGSTYRSSSALDTFAQSQKLRKEIEKIMYGRFSTLEMYESAACIFQDESKGLAYLGAINKCRKRKRSISQSPTLRDRLNLLLNMGLRDLAHSGRTDLGPVGLMLGAASKSPGMDIHEFGETPDKMTMLVNKIYFPIFDIILFGERGVGKTNIGNNYMSLPWMIEYDNPVISAVPIKNEEDFNSSKKMYQDFPYKSQAISAICDIRLNDIDEGTKTPILSFNDESGILAGRSKTQTKMVHDQTVFCYISRHFRLTSIWTYQLDRDLPHKIGELAGQYVYVDSHQSVRRSVKVQGRGEIIQKFYGWKGWQQLKKDGGPGKYIEYSDEVPSTSMWNLDTLQLLAVVNNEMANLKSKDVNKEKRFYQAVKSFCDDQDTGAISGVDTKKHFIKHAAITLGLINQKLYFGLDGDLYVNDGNMSAKYVDKETGRGLTASSLGYLLEPLEITPAALGQIMHKLYLEINKNPGIFKANSQLSNEEEEIIDKIADDTGVYDQIRED